MTRMILRSAPALAAILLLSCCGEAVKVDGNIGAEEQMPQARDAVTGGSASVRIGELGPSFRACVAEGTTRNVGDGEKLPVRAAPFENSSQTGDIGSRGQFFVCSRTLDQKWFGIVYDGGNDGTSPRCGVSDPLSSPRAYAGPCHSGWVSSAFVKLVAGIEPPPLPQPEAPSTQ